ncbi:MAG: hypothetical protein ACOCXE_04445, partial [Spirochaetota bacterium]
TESFEVTPPAEGVYRYRRDETAVFRYFFILDGRVPTEPDIRVDARGRRALVSMTGSRGAEVEYEIRVEGRTVSEGDYERPVELSLPAGRTSGEIEVRAVSAYADGRRSEPANVRRDFDTRPPQVPSLELPDDEPGASRTLSVRADAESTVLYEIGFGADPPAPDEFSPRLDSTSASLELPHGVEGRASIRLRARDAAGNMSEPSRVYRVELDARPPRPPRITVDRSVVRIEGEGTVYYRLNVAGEEAAGEGEADSAYGRYEGPFRLGGRAAEKVRYEVTAFARDDAGNRSEPVTIVEEVDRRIPRVPAAVSVTDGGWYAEPEVRFQVSGADDDLILHYTATTDGSVPPDPTSEDATVPREGVPYSASEGEEIPVHVKVVPRFAGSELTGRMREFRFTLDRRPPELPAVTGVEPGEAYPAPRRLDLEPADPDGERITVTVRETIGEEETSESTFAYSEPVLLSGSAGRETRYEIDLRVTDRAGNTRALDEPLRVRVDREAPEAGELVVSGEEGTSVFGTAADGPVVLRPSSDTLTRYELTDDGSQPAPVSRSSPRLGDELRLSGRADGEVLYRLAYRSEDEAGNLSRETMSLAMEVDRRPPPPPSEPSVRIAGDGRSARLAWSTEPGLRTGFRMVDDRDGDFRRGDENSEISFPAGETRMTVEAVQVDRVGNRSETRRFEIRGFTVSPRPQLGGVRPKETYGDTVVVRNDTQGATVRYELGTGDEEPDEPTRFSDELPRSLSFDASRGETVRYTLRARSFSAEARPSEVVELSFTVDRTPPAPPELVNARSGDFYTESRAVELEAPEGEIRYRLSLVQEARGDFRPYRGQVMLDAVRGRLAHYRLEAFTVDEAGNRSGAPRVWDLYIDQEIVYVSADAETGDGDTGDGRTAGGGRDAPFSRLSDAVEFARSRDRRTIFVAGGSYAVSSPLRIEGDLSIQGGLSPATWRRAEDEVSEIRTAEDFDGEALLELEDVSLTIERLDVTVDGAAALDAESATIFMQGVSVMSSGSPETLRLVDSEFELRNSDIRAADMEGEAAIVLDGGSAALENAAIEAERPGAGFSVMQVSGDGNLRMRDAQLVAGQGRRSTVLRIDESVAEIYESELRGGPGRESGDVLRSRLSEVLLRDSILAASADASIATVVGASGGELRIEGNTLEIEGERGATGLFARGSRIIASRNAFRAGDTADYIHLTSLRDVNATIDTNLFIGGRSRELIVGRIAGSQTALYYNTIHGGVGSRFTQGFNLSGASRARLVNNVVFHAGDGTGTAIYAGTDVRPLEISSNAFSGWDVVYREAPDGRRWVPPGGDPASEARTAEALDRREDVESASNLDLADQDVFTDDVHLKSGVPLIDAGEYVGGGDAPRVDWDGQERPRPGEGPSDIGADEFVR